MGLFDSLFGGDDPSEEANKYLEQIPGKIEPYYKPYMEAGQQALPQLQGQYSNLLNDPGGMINKIGAGYKSSPGFNFALQKALEGGNRAFAAGGMGGSPSSSIWGMDTAQGLASQDYNNYLSHALSQYGLGLQGEQNLATGGQNAASGYSDQLAQTLAQQGKLAYEGAQAKNAAAGQLLTTGLGLGLAPFTGGTSLALLGAGGGGAGSMLGKGGFQMPSGWGGV